MTRAAKLATVMRTEFRAVRTAGEIRSLLGFDRKVFSAADRFPASYWMQVQSYWMIVGLVKVGCCAFEKHVDFDEDLTDAEVNSRRKGSLYIASTAILPRYQGRGFGRLMKCWQIAYATHHKFSRIVTNTRQSNHAMIDLNRKFGFEVIRVTPDYYSDPSESAVVMELRIAPISA